MFRTPEITDQVIQAAAAGAAAERSLLISAILPQVRAMVSVRLVPHSGQAHDVDDVVQQVLLGVSEGLEGLNKATLGGLKGFVSTIVTRRVADYLSGLGNADAACVSLERLTGSFSSMGLARHMIPGSDFSPRSIALRAEQARQALVELYRLKPEYRDVILLAFFDQLSISDIAERQATTRASVSMLLMRAVRALRGRLTDTSGPIVQRDSHE